MTSRRVLTPANGSSEEGALIRGLRRGPALLLAVVLVAAALAGPAEARSTASFDVRASVADTDGDGLDDASDGCPTVASSNPTGCPTVRRSARLRYLSGKNLLQAQIVSPATACSSRSRIKLWRAMSSGDVRVRVETSSFSGRKRFTVRRGAGYYVTVSSSYAPGIAECAEATSRTVVVPRGS